MMRSNEHLYDPLENTIGRLYALPLRRRKGWFEQLTCRRPRPLNRPIGAAFGPSLGCVPRAWLRRFAAFLLEYVLHKRHRFPSRFRWSVAFAGVINRTLLELHLRDVPWAVAKMW